MSGKIKQGLGNLIGNSGEYFVVAELLMRGVVAALAPRNAPGFDVLATKGEQTVRIRVKTRSEAFDIWQWNAKKDGTIFPFQTERGSDFTVLVNLSKVRSQLAFWIVPTNSLDGWLKQDFAEWLATPGAKGQQRNEKSSKRHLAFTKYEKHLEPFRENWDILWLTDAESIAGQ
jgi:hypothetical protein